MTAQVAAEDEVQQVKLLTGTNDDHGGIIVEMEESVDSTTFVSMLKASISHWKELVVSLFIAYYIHFCGDVTVDQAQFFFHALYNIHLCFMLWLSSHEIIETGF